MTIQETYNDLFNTKLGLAGVCPVGAPSQPLLGTYGRFENGIYQIVGTIQEFGIQSVPGTPASFQDSFEMMTSDIASVNFDMDGGYHVVPEIPIDAANAGIEFTFKNHNQISVKASGLSMAEIDLKVFDKIADKVRDRSKFYDWRFVTSVVTATSVVQFGSESKSGNIKLCGNGNALTEYGAVSLIAGLSFEGETEMTFNYIETPSLTPVPLCMNMLSYSKHHDEKLYYQRNGAE